MLPSDIHSVLYWWFTLFIIGIGFLPLTVSIFHKFFDLGYVFSKVLGLTLTSYTIFLLGVLHITKFTQLSSISIFLALTLVFYLKSPKRPEILLILKNSWKFLLFEELLFLGGLFFWAYIHSFNPDIHGLEKYMDFGILNSILRADYFPPKDMWFTPFPINYYYFGHLVTAVITKISGLSSNITFNLMLSTIFAFCLSETFSLGANLYHLSGIKNKFQTPRLLLSGVLTALLVTFSGNLHILYGFFKAYPNDDPAPFWKLPFLPLSFPNAYWYPNATRYIYHTIHEFPIYSWVVADLHGHVLDIPFVLLTIAVLLSLLMNSKEIISHKLSAISYQLLIGFLLAVMYMTNAWDGGIYLLFSSLVLFFIYRSKLKNFLISFCVVFLGLVLFSMPYSYFFKPFASGIGILCAPTFLVKIGKIGPFLFEKDHCQHSYWWQLLTLYGFFYFFVISFGAFAARSKKLLQTDVFVFLLIILSTFLIILPEFIYLKDIYPAHYRANTMFKLVFQSFMMLSISCGYIIVRLISNFKFQISNFSKKIFAICYLLFAICLITLVMTYPFLAVNSYYGLDQKDTKGQSKKPTGLDGTTYLKTLYPGDYEAINWLNKNIKGQPVILEAQSDSYTDFARVSSNTGLPTVLGWTVHEWLWRGTYDIPAPRIAEIKTIYETPDPQTAKKLLNKYNVRLIFIGTLEYQKYPQLSEAKFQVLGRLLYQNQTTKIYQVY